MRNHGLSLALASACLLMLGAPLHAEVLFDFEEFPDGTLLTTQLQDQGIVFPHGATVIDCSLVVSDDICTSARSGTKVIVPPSGELEHNRLVVDFTSPQSWAVLYVRGDASGAPQSATLTGFDADGSVTWIDDEGDISAWGLGMEVQGGFPAEPIMTRVVLTSSFHNFFHVDDLRISGDSPPPPDTTPPSLTIVDPPDGATVTLTAADHGRVPVRVTASDAGLATVAGWAEHDASGTRHPLEFCGTSTVCPLGATLDRTSEFFDTEHEGAYTLYVQACDGSDNCTELTQGFVLELPEPPILTEADLWVLGIEYNQGFQDHVFTDLGNPDHVGHVPFSCGYDRCPDSRYAQPVFPGRPMAVRVYVGVRGDVSDYPAPPESVPVTGTLLFSTCQVGTNFRHFRPIENAACQDHLGRAMPCRRVIEAYPSLGSSGLRTNTAFDLDLVAMRSDLGQTLNFVVPAEWTARIRESGCMSLDVEVEIPAGESFVDPNELNNRFEFAMENVADPNPLVVRQVRVGVGSLAAPSRPAADQAMAAMMRMTVPYDELRVDSDTRLTYDGSTLSIGLGGDLSFDLDQCQTLWARLYGMYGLDARRTLVGLYSGGATLTGCAGLGWRVPRPIPVLRSRDDYLGGVALGPPNARGTLAQELYHADLDRRHVSDLHGEATGCALAGGLADFLGIVFNLDASCFHDSVHPHGEIGTYPAALVRIGAPPGPGLFDGTTIYGNVGNVGLEMQLASGAWQLTLYDPCPTGPLNWGNPLLSIVQRWRTPFFDPEGDPDVTGYECAIDDSMRPHDFMSYGPNPWAGLQLNPFLKSVNDRGARAVFSGGAWVGDASKLYFAEHEDDPGHTGAAPRARRAPAARAAEPRAARRRGKGKRLEGGGLQFSAFVTAAGEIGLAPLSLPMGATTPVLGRRERSATGLEMVVVDAGGVVGRAPVAVSVAPPHPERMAVLVGGLPEGVAPEELRLTVDGSELARFEASASAPALALLSPRGGEVWPRFSTRSVEWTASDADGDDLWTTVRFSADDGETWRPLGVLGGGATSLDVDTGELPVTSRARIWVTVSDGMRVVEDRSPEPFTIAGFCEDDAGCDDGDPCTVDTCSGGQCLPAWLGGFDGLHCELDKLLDPEICGVDPLDAKLARQIGKKVAKAHKALDKAEAAAKEKKAARALAKAGKQLEKIARKARKSARKEHVSAFCGHAIDQRAAGRLRLLAELQR